MSESGEFRRCRNSSHTRISNVPVQFRTAAQSVRLAMADLRLKISQTPAAMTSASVGPAKRSSPPPSADLSRPNPGQPPAKRVRDNKFDPSVLPTSSDAVEILKQVEFYFSDANLPRDKFLWTLTQSDPKREGWVPISTIASFKRMQRFQPFEAVVAALRTSKELLEVNEDGTAVRRRNPLVKPSEEDFHEINARSIYAVYPSCSQTYD